MRSPKEAVAYARKIHQMVRYIGISDGNMQEGSFRMDANISLRPKGRAELGTRAEIKNINSFRFLERALNFEIERQQDILEAGGKVVQETRLYDPQTGMTRSMRGKEEAHDYRYFPDPDLMPLVIDAQWIEAERALLPELPDVRRRRYQDELGLNSYDAEVLTAERSTAEYFEACVALLPGQAKGIANWVMGELARKLNDGGITIAESPVTPALLVDLLKLVDAGTISGKIAKTVFDAMWATGHEPACIVKEQGLVQVSDTGAIEPIIDAIIAANPDQVEEYRGGKEKVFGFFVGQVMKEMKGKANPALVNELLKKKLGG
jgi:aspartyl-tRNA(Asn)/glutamyl-tRNA(Gln) amidotransferase subunit B